ncbi:hypothetical protein LAZ67_3001082 [Cordylochernes scorpioides]|uniref:Mos1 transposase HTH domain-containing protein n=1 Tax=Cordylochernes scorpioides TaxID=51811 RepID=A0ABY6K6M1_9ARAC|nr:hypothetical protein LAZ67_3001082 [Cordylochernes scorpioides]
MEDERICIKFCVKNGFKGAEIFWMLQTTYGDAVMSRRRVFEWYKRFKESREETADNERSGRPSTSTTPEKVDKVLELVRENRRITVREVAEEARTSFGSTQSIMKDILGNARKETASLNLEATTDDPELLKRVITGDETFIYGFDSETTQQSSEWRFKNEPRPKKARKAPSKVKVMLTVFFDYQGIVHHEFQQQGSTITADSYLGVLRRLREAIRTISRRLVANGLHSCRPLRRLPLTPPNRRQRLEWCRARSTWMTEWHRVVFSDESRFCLSSDSRRVRVWRRRGERSNPAAIVERPTVRQRGIMVWGAIAYDSRSPLLRIQGTMTAQRYVDDVLRPVTLPYLQGVPNALYQQDNARPHTARISQ